MTIPDKFKKLNKYKLTPTLIRHLIPDRTMITKQPFTRNNVINAWMLTGDTAKNEIERTYGSYDEYWLGIYDKDAKAYAGKVRWCFSSAGGMCDYKVTRFLDPKQIENNDDLMIQVKFLTELNSLIDKGVLKLPEKENSRGIWKVN